MKMILLFGAGKSATCLIEYLGKCCMENDWRLVVCDSNLFLAQSKIINLQNAKAISFDVTNEKKRHEWILKADIVISMLPPALHFLVAGDCITFSKNLLNASYLDEKIRSFEKEIKEKQLIFLGEMGLDPGLDHMSAMRMIHHIKSKGGKITSFKSHCGGLVSPESDDNPWHYKITWNPASVVSAGSSGAVFLKDEKTIEIPYDEIFNDENKIVIPGLSTLTWYPNRDSLTYLNTYQLSEASTFIRTTLRYPSFCRGWKKIIQLDLTNKNDHQEIKDCATFSDWFQLKKEKLLTENDFSESDFFNDEFSLQINFLGLNDAEAIAVPAFNSSLLLQHLLETKLKMQPHDKDIIIMLHEIEYIEKEKNRKITSCLIVKGDDRIHTAMAKTVGLPLGIATKLILQNKIKVTGLHIPVIPEIYEPVLQELKLNGIGFTESVE
jgi:saccharopine dehydrogenase (NADP+, L-glutamate forming)